MPPTVDANHENTARVRGRIDGRQRARLDGRAPRNAGGELQGRSMQVKLEQDASMVAIQTVGDAMGKVQVDGRTG